MNKLAYILRDLSRTQKLIILVISDFIVAFLCWIVFGPPFAVMIASNFSTSLYQLIQENILVSSFHQFYYLVILYFWFL